MLKRLARFVLAFALAGSMQAASAPTQPDSRLKADVLLIVAHPDDETGISAYLAKLLDEHKRVAAVYLTKGDAGHNNMGTERAKSLGLVREMELRHALTKLGVENVWVLNYPDTPSQNVLRSLADWHHGEALEDVVRIVRLTRPEIILTWLPAFRIGENHGDHQAAGVLATEAFDISGDPAVFPAQLAAAVSLNETFLEGLQPWQVQKLYYFSDASDETQFQATGPLLSATDISPTRNLPYWQIALSVFSYHLTQYRGYIEKMQAMDAQQLDKAAKDGWAQPQQLIFGKSKVKASTTGDPFEGVSADPVPFVRSAVATAPQSPPAILELAGPWAFYEAFAPEHELTHLPHLSVPQIAINRGSTLTIPLTLRNSGIKPKTLTLSVVAPAGWVVESGAGEYTVDANSSVAATVKLTSPTKDDGTLQTIRCQVDVPDEHPSSIELQVKLRSGGLPQ